MTRAQRFKEIAEEASREVQKWPEWMQRQNVGEETTDTKCSCGDASKSSDSNKMQDPS